MSRPHTIEEIREEFLETVRAYVDYWHNLKREKWLTEDECLDKLRGLAFSILVILDGGTNLPGFLVIPNPHPDDKAYHEENGDNYYPEPSLENDIGGGLHETLWRKSKIG